MKRQKIYLCIMAMVIGLLACVGCSVEQKETAINNVSIKETFIGTRYQASDGSVIYFEEGGTFKWYRDDSDHNDNYYGGTFDFYIGEAAQEYIVNELQEYGVTKGELQDYFERNKESDMYLEENFLSMVLHTQSLIMDGEELVEESYDKNYMGFFKDGIFDGTNMSSGEYAYFQLLE